MLFEQVVRTISPILITLDGEGRVDVWNPSAARVFGVSEVAARGRRLVELLPSIAAQIEDLVARCTAQGTTVHSDDLHFKCANGAHGLIGLGLTALENEGRREVLILGREVTEQRRFDAQLAHALKLESIGQLAAGIAHEINTPTQFVSDNACFLRDSFAELAPLLQACAKLASAEDGQIAPLATELVRQARALDLSYLDLEIPKALDESLAGLARIAKIVAAMKEFSHPGTGEKVAVDLNRAIESTITVARNEWKYVAEVALDLAADLPLVPCLPDEMNQVVLNLLINAAHAIADKHAAVPGRRGRIAISTRAVGEWAELCVADDGAGIPESIRERIFDPFFTTKAVGKGTGQGLAIARSVVVGKHRGTIAFDSALGVGTTFTIRVPLQIVSAEALTTVVTR